MSVQNAALKASATDNGDATLELDVSKLHALPSEQQELYLLTFVSGLWRHVEAQTNDALGAQVASIKKEIIKIIGLGAPSPSRIIRHTVGQILATLFVRGSKSLLFETLNDLLAILNAGKGEKDIGSKHATVVALGHVYLTNGESAVSQSGLICSSLIKLLKPAQANVGLKASIYRALSFIVKGLGPSIDESVARDIWKYARSAASGDKAAIVQRQACNCLSSLACIAEIFGNSSDFDSLKSAIFKAIESDSAAVRHASASALAQSLLGAYAVGDHSETVPIVKKPRKAKKQADQDQEVDGGRPGSPAPSKTTYKLFLSLKEILRTLSSQYCKSSTSNQSRAGIILCYKLVLQQLPDRAVEEHYAVVADHFFTDVLNQPTITFNRYRTLLTRRYVQMLLDDVVGGRILTEGGQINAARFLINDILKNYPKVIQERREPPKRVLAAALRSLSALISKLGAATSAFQDACREAVLQVLQHPNYSVQIHAAHCIKALAQTCPQQSQKSTEACLSRLQKDLSQSQESRQPPVRLLGYANSLAGIISTTRQHSLYGSVDLLSRTFNFAIELLKASGSSELRLSAAQIQVAWTTIGGLMSLGPSFVKVHLSQLLLLWRNALPVPLTADNAAKRSHLELSFLGHVRECSLGALLVFLQFNRGLLTIDSTRRISSLLHNSVLFVESLPRNRSSDELSNRLVPALQLHDISVMLQRRLLQCFVALLKIKHIDHREALAQSDVLNLAIRAFTSPENPLPKSLESSISSSASAFERLWDHGDNWAFGVNSFVRGGEFQAVDLESSSTPEVRSIAPSSRDEVDLELVLPAGLAFEHDPLAVYGREQSSNVDYVSAATSVVNQGIVLFASALPLLSAKVQESAFEQLVSSLAQPLQREPGKKAALQVNIVTATLSALIVSSGQSSFSGGNLIFASVEKAAGEIAYRAIADPDPAVRSVGALSLGYMAHVSGSEFTNSSMKQLVDTVVANRDPNVRAGCALSMGYVHSLVGGMAASHHLKAVVGVLLSLCSDGHPIVHYWALKGLIEVCNSAGLTFSSYATSTLGLLAQLFSSDNHSAESALAATSNIELEYPSPPLIGKCVDAVLNVLGPDLQDISKARQLILTMIGYFRHDELVDLQAQGSICLGHLALYAPAHLPFAKHVLGLQKALRSENDLLRMVGIKGLSSLMKRNASEVVRVATSSFSDDLWLTLDEMPQDKDLHSIFQNWLLQTFITTTTEWVDQCQTILSKTRLKPIEKLPAMTAKSTAAPDLGDEEVAGFAAAAAVAQGETPDAAVQSQEFLRWQSRDFAMSLLNKLIELVSRSTMADQATPAESALQSRLADIIRMAFSASTANVVHLRVWGLKIIDQVLRLFGRTPDPDFLEASLLEQYQAQIASALTPAFAADSSAELAAEAIGVCATFVSAGIVVTVERMGRIFKVLVQGLDNVASSESETSLGDLKNIGANAQSMLKMAVLSAWADLVLASNEQPYLEDIVKPYVSRLAPLWLSSMQEFAQLRFEPDISSSLGGDNPTETTEERYSAFVRDVRLKYYQQNWLSIVDAIAILVDKDSESIFEALDAKPAASKKQPNGVSHDERDISFREEPVAFFFILFGLAFEALVVQAREDASQAHSILQALKKILKPAVCGTAIYEEIVFNETTDTLDRLALTTDHDTQMVLVDISRNLSLNHISANSDTDRNEKLSDDIEQLFELTRIIVLVLSGLIPTLEDPPAAALRTLSEEGVGLVRRSFQALVEVSDVFPSVIRSDLTACIIHSYCSILATGVCQAEVVPQLMPAFKAFVTDIARSAAPHSQHPSTTLSSRLLRGCLQRFLGVLTYAQRRENEYALSCAKNTLLSITILLTSAGSLIPPNEPLIQEAISELLDCLHDVGLARTSANCIRTLLLTQPKSACDEAASYGLWAGLLAFIGNYDSEDNGNPDPEAVRPSVVQSLVIATSTLSGRPAKAAAMSILIPFLILFAEQNTAPGGNGTSSSKVQLGQQLLDLANADGAVFRAIVAQLDEHQKKILQDLLRNAAGSSGRTTGINGEQEEGLRGKPAIELRMDF